MRDIGVIFRVHAVRPAFSFLDESSVLMPLISFNQLIGNPLVNLQRQSSLARRDYLGEEHENT